MWFKSSLHIFILQAFFVWVYIIWPPLSRWLMRFHGGHTADGLADEIEALQRNASGRARKASANSGFRKARQGFDERVHKTFQEQARRRSGGFSQADFAGHDKRSHQASPPPPPRDTSQRRKHLRTLGLHESADPGAIRFAYRDLAKQNHPDRFAAAYFSDKERAQANERMQEINVAYEWLTANPTVG